MDNYKYKLKGNILKNYIFIFLSRLDLTQGIWMIYLAVKGMTLTQLGLLEGIFHLVSFTMEVPTGVVADLWGRRISRIMGRGFAMVSMIVLMFSNSFFMFAIAFAILAISFNLESGAGEALIYDSLKEIDLEAEYIKVNGKNEMFMQIASVVALLLGGYLASKNYLYAFGFSAILAAIAMGQAFSFVEPSIEIENKENKNQNIFFSQIKDSFSVIRNNKKVGFLIIFINIIALSVTSLFYYLQNYWKIGGYSEFQIAIFLSISSLLAGFMATKVYKLEALIKEKGIIAYMPFIIVSAMWGITLTNFAPIFYIVIGVTESIVFVATSDYINKLIPSENRATILSFQSMVFSLLMICVFPIIGKIGDSLSLNFAFKIMATLGTLLALMNAYMVLKVENKSIK
jgi:MFS family permease